MADYTITAANVVPVAGTGTAKGVSAGAITIGQAVYRNTSGKLAPAQADADTTDAVFGIALSQAAAADQPITVATSGPLTIGSVIPVGDIVVLSAAASGAMAPSDDLLSADYVTLIGVATDATTLTLRTFNTGVAKA